MFSNIALGTIIRILLATALIVTSVNSYADFGKVPASAPAVTATAKYQLSAAKLLKENENRLVKEAGEALAETSKALQALERNNPKEALADLDVVTIKLHAVLARDAAMKEAPFKAEASVVAYDGNLDSVREAVKKARDLAGTGQPQAVGQILDQLVSEIRITATSLPLEAYSQVIEMATSMIVAGNIDRAKALLDDAVNRLPVTTTDVYPLPLFAAEESLMEAYRMEQSTDFDKEEKQKKY